jgi:murein DD-endopeptidase MepM/ murein hydrolase activator NlpD
VLRISSILSFLVLLLVTACSPQAAVVEAVNLPVEAAPAGDAPSAPTATLPSPVHSTVIAPTITPTGLPGFSLVELQPTATGNSETAVEARTLPTETPQATAEPSPTPQPTFTPPALPFTSPNEHYWLRRPIAEGGTVWTDKSYPYGGTRGGTLRPHHGVEFYVPTGTEVLAAASGTVVVSGTDGETILGPHADFYGNLIIIELDTSFNEGPVFNVYAHLSELFVAEGQHVEAQEIIALSGATGVADGPHLHFEVRVGENNYNSTRNPLLWLYPFPEHGVVAGRVLRPGGELVQAQQVFLRRIDAPSKYAETTTYANWTGELNGDEGWQENFVFDDVVAGYYEVEVRKGEEKFREEVWVYPYRTSSVEVTMSN